MVSVRSFPIFLHMRLVLWGLGVRAPSDDAAATGLVILLCVQGRPLDSILPMSRRECSVCRSGYVPPAAYTSTLRLRADEFRDLRRPRRSSPPRDYLEPHPCLARVGPVHATMMDALPAGHCLMKLRRAATMKRPAFPLRHKSRSFQASSFNELLIASIPRSSLHGRQLVLPAARLNPQTSVRPTRIQNESGGTSMRPSTECLTNERSCVRLSTAKRSSCADSPQGIDQAVNIHDQASFVPHPGPRACVGRYKD